MNMQELLNQLSSGIFQVESCKKIPGSTSNIGTIMEIRFYGPAHMKVAVHFEGMKWDTWFSDDAIQDQKYYLKDLKTFAAEG